MPQFDEKELNDLMRLCRINCTAEEKEKLRDSLSKVLKYVELLKEVDTEGVEPCWRVFETGTHATRQDVVGDTLEREVFLANAPSHVGGMVRVPPVIKFSNP